jgi:hypothetical protein
MLRGTHMTRTIQEIRAERDRHLAQPETRATYALKFYSQWCDGRLKALNTFDDLMDVIEYNIEPYELY